MRYTQIRQAKQDSGRDGSTVLVLQDDRNREFFRFEDEKLIEYDATKLNGLRVKLTEEELETIESFNL